MSRLEGFGREVGRKWMLFLCPRAQISGTLIGIESLIPTVAKVHGLGALPL